jgi:ribose 5-phosphate isomerase B
MSYAANRVKGIRAALCMNEYQARLSRTHNDANILVLGERVIGPDLALSILEIWLEAEFESGRHQRRIELLDQVDG